MNNTLTPLQIAQNRLYAIAGGSLESGDVRLAKLTTAQRMDYFRGSEFQTWVASERAAGREVFWLKDVDMTQSEGDIFTFFLRWRAENGLFSRKQLGVIRRFLGQRGFAKQLSLCSARKSTAAHTAIALWEAKRAGGEGLGLLDLWKGVYWPSQIGLTRAEKQQMVRDYVPHFAQRVYTGVREENQLLEALGVHVVVVSNGDQELAIAAAPVLGIRPENVVASHLKYDASGISIGVNHSYEVFDEEWETKPQPGKPLSFHFWAHNNRARFGWNRLNMERLVIAGKDGDSASADGGMMILLQESALGNFMIDTPGEPARIKRFYSLAAKYGWTPGKFFTLAQEKRA